MLTKDTILSKLARRTKTVQSEVFGGDLCIREHTRAEYRTIMARADKGTPGETDRINAIRTSVRAWLTAYQDVVADDAKTMLNAVLDNDGSLIDNDRWNGGLFANAVIDAATGAPLFTTDDVLTFPERTAVWVEVRRIAQESLDLSEVGPDALKSGDPTPDQG